MVATFEVARENHLRMLEACRLLKAHKPDLTIRQRYELTEKIIRESWEEGGEPVGPVAAAMLAIAITHLVDVAPPF